MNVSNQVHPGREQILRFLDTEGPVCMVNLLKFREKADYEDGRDPDLSGAEAFGRYARKMKSLVEASGGRVVFGAEISGLLLGEVDDLWDQVAIVEYPSAKTLLEIASSPEFRAIEIDRVAGLAGQLNITTRDVGIAGIGH